MKKILTSSLIILIGIFKGYAQTAPPQGINYQAVAMDMNNRQIAGEDIPAQPVAEKEIRVRFSILKDNENGTLTYREVHLVKTDAFGLFNTVIGQGIPDASPGLFDQITWETGSHFLKVEIDITGIGITYQDLGTQQLWSVPYALYSKYANVAGNGIKSVVDNGDGSLTFTYIDGSTYKTSVLKSLAGPAGPQGPAGINGTNGVSIINSYVQNDSLYVVLSNGQTLNTGYVRGIAGKDGVGLTNSYIQNDSLYVVLSNSQILNTGHVKGKSGTNGYNALIKTTSEPKGSNCANGGTKFETGLDVNGNGALDSLEIDTVQTKYVCNGSGVNGISSLSFDWKIPDGLTNKITKISYTIAPVTPAYNCCSSPPSGWSVNPYVVPSGYNLYITKIAYAVGYNSSSLGIRVNNVQILNSAATGCSYNGDKHVLVGEGMQVGFAQNGFSSSPCYVSIHANFSGFLIPKTVTVICQTTAYVVPTGFKFIRFDPTAAVPAMYFSGETVPANTNGYIVPN